MENDRDFTFMELIMQLSEDTSVSEDPALRMQMAYGLMGCLASLVM